MPMQQDYAFIFMHSGDMSDAVTQESVLDMWAVRTGEIAGTDPSLAVKMRQMGNGIEFLEIDLAAPENVARQGRSGLKPVVFANAWPGTSRLAYHQHQRIRLMSQAITPCVASTLSISFGTPGYAS